MTLKRHLMQVLENCVAPFRENRERLKQNPQMVLDLLQEGTSRAKKEGQRKLEEIKDAMRINYRLDHFSTMR